MFRNKIFSDDLFLFLSFESSESYSVLNDFLDSNSIFRAAGINSEKIFGLSVMVEKSRGNPWPKRSWMRESEAWKPEVKGEVAAHLSPMDAAWTWPSGNIFSRQTQTWPDSNLCFSESSWKRRMERSISRHQSLRCTTRGEEIKDDEEQRR